MNRRFAAVFIALLLSWISSAEAQLSPAEDHLGADFLQPQISAGFSTATARNFQDLNGTFGVRGATVTVAVPVIQDLEGTSENRSAYFVLARGQFSSSNEDISFLPASHIIYRTRVGVTGGIATAGRHLYLLTIGGGFSEDRNTVGSPKIRTTGSLLGKYQLDNSFAFIYGLSYSYTFDRGLLLPLLGTHCSLGDDLSIHIVLPFSLDIGYDESPDLKFAFLIRANGDQVHIEEQSYFGPQSLPLFMKVAQIQSGFRVSVKVYKDLWLQGEAGVLRNRDFAIGTLDANLVSSKIENSGYSTIVFRYDLGNFESWGD